MIREETLYLEDIIRSIGKLEELLERFSKEPFDEDWVVQDAAIRELEIIGEAANKLSAEFRDRHPDIPWREIIATRNYAAHAYYEIDLNRMWETISTDLPQLKAALAEEQAA